jgi:hypothetical protein
MKLILVASLAAVLGLSISGESMAGGYAPVAGGSIYWANDNVFVGFNYGGAYPLTYYAPPRYVYRAPVYGPVYYRSYRDGRYRGSARDYSRGYKKGYRSGYRQGHHDRRGRGHKGRGRGHHGDH